MSILQHATRPSRPPRPSSAALREPQETSPRRRRLVAVRGGVGEIAILAGAWIFYSLARGFAQGDAAIAHAHAIGIWNAEKFLHIDVESAVNHATSSVTWLGVGMSFWYASLHYLVTPAVLIWLYRRHRDSYSRARTAIITGSAIALVCYVLLPTAPPRLTGTTFVDTLSRYSGYGWWSDHASAPAGLGQLTDELAAMPSLHVGWTLWVVWALWRHVGRTVRSMSILYSAGTTFVVIGTGNHWILDAVAGGAVILVGILASPHLVALADVLRRERRVVVRWTLRGLAHLRVWVASGVGGREITAVAVPRSGWTATNARTTAERD